MPTHSTNTESVEARLSQFGDRWVTPNRTSLLAQVEEIYRANKVLDSEGFALALQDACPSRVSCWKSARHRLQPPGILEPPVGENASMPWPWIGEGYRPGGVCFITLNLNMEDGNAGSLGVEYEIANEVMAAFGAGDRTPYGSSPFFWSLLSTAGAILASLDGRQPEAECSDAATAVAALERIARVQAVKCTPTGNRSYPTPQMRANCPDRFAVPEIQILQPGVIVAMGNDAFNALESLSSAGADWQETGDYFGRGLMLLDQPTEVIWMFHSTAPQRWWQPGQLELVKSLKSRPLRRRPAR